MKDPVGLARKIVVQYQNEHNRELLNQILQDNNITLDFWPFEEKVLGVLWEDAPGHITTIAVNLLHDSLQQIFAIAHLLGHHFLEHGNSICLTNTLSLDLKEEQEANLFAAELLMCNKTQNKKPSSMFSIKDLAELWQIPESLLLWKAKTLR